MDQCAQLFMERVRKTKDFDAEQRERHAGIDPSTLEFRLGGRTLRRLPSFSPYVLTDFQAKESPSMADTIDYMKAMIEPASHAALEEALRGTTMDTMLEVTGWLVEQASSRPTSLASSSSDGRNGTGTISTESSPPELVSTSAP